MAFNLAIYPERILEREQHEVLLKVKSLLHSYCRIPFVIKSILIVPMSARDHTKKTTVKSIVAMHLHKVNVTN